MIPSRVSVVDRALRSEGRTRRSPGESWSILQLGESVSRRFRLEVRALDSNLSVPKAGDAVRSRLARVTLTLSHARPVTTQVSSGAA